MAEKLWKDMDRYITDLLVPSDPALEAALESSKAAGLPTINVAANQGKLLHLLARLGGARRILEIGTLGGYSTIWLARALAPAPGGRMVTLEFDPKHAKVAKANIARAGLAEVVEVRIGPAIAALPKLQSEGAGPFDLIFIDADKESTPDYFQWALKLSRIGTAIVVDNVVRGGEIADGRDGDAGLQGVRKFYEMVATEKRVSATAIQTVGSKGHDGFALVLVIA
jgi:predicted O-methyltransferase YrrM